MERGQLAAEEIIRISFLADARQQEEAVSDVSLSLEEPPWNPEEIFDVPLAADFLKRCPELNCIDDPTLGPCPPPSSPQRKDLATPAGLSLLHLVALLDRCPGGV